MDEQEGKQPTRVQGIITWVSAVSGIVIIGTSVYAVYLVREVLPMVGYVIIGATTLLPVIGLAYLATHFFRYFTKSEVVEIGPTGNIVKQFNRITEIHPLGIKEHSKKSAKTVVTEEKTNTPAITDLLKEGLLGGRELLLGYRQDGTPRWGMWSDLRTFAVAGKSRSGKTVTLVFFILQILLSGAEVWIADPHFHKPTGLLRILKPLLPFLKIAVKPTEIVSLVQSYQDEMHARERNESDMGDTDNGWRPVVLIFDEWTKLLRDLEPTQVDTLVCAVLDAGEAYANFGGYAIVAGHEWTASESGGKKKAAIRRAFHAACVHRLDSEYAKFLLQGGKGQKAAKEAPNLKTGTMFFMDSEGELEVLTTPYYGEDRIAIREVADTLLQLQGAAVPQLLEEAVNGPVNGKQGVNSPVNEPVEPVTSVFEAFTEDINGMELEPAYMAPVNAQVNSNEQLIKIVKRLLAKDVPHRDIAYAIGMYGTSYDKYRALLKEADIVI